MAEGTKKPLGRILLQQRAISQAELDNVLASHKPGGPPLASRLLAQGKVTEISALKALSEQYGVPGIDLNQICLRLSDLEDLPREVALRHKLLVVLSRQDRLFCAMAMPTDTKVIDELEFVTGKRVFAYIALEAPLLRAIVACYDMRERGEVHYIGPKCPEEVLRKAGVDDATIAAHLDAMRQQEAAEAAAAAKPKPPPPPPRPRVERKPPPPRRPLPVPAAKSDDTLGEARFRPSTQSMRAVRPEEQQVIVDDAMEEVSERDSLTEADFDANTEESVAGVPPQAAATAPPAERREGQSTILVVDDEADIRKMLRRVLEDKGYRVVEADRGLAALQTVKHDPPDLLVLDAMLPEVHGFDIARRIKGSQRYGHIPIIMISAVYRGWRFAEDAKASYGVQAYIEKPFKVADVLKAVQAALEAPSQRRDVERISKEAERLLAEGIKMYRSGDIDGATQRLRRGTELDPLAYRLHFHLGLLYGKKGQLYDAIQELETSLQINAGHFPALKNLAVLYQKAGFRNKAIETWERAVAAAPDEATRTTIKEHLLGLL